MEGIELERLIGTEKEREKGKVGDRWIGRKKERDGQIKKKG